MGFGFVVARFGLFLQALQIGQSNFQARPYGLSFWFGTALIVLGVIVNLASAWSHVRLVQELNRGGSAFNRPSILAIAISVILAVRTGDVDHLFQFASQAKQILRKVQEKSMTSNKRTDLNYPQPSIGGPDG